MAIATTISAGSRALEKLWAKRQARNGNGHPSAASQKLEKWDMDWRKDVDEELERFQRALFEPEGALRMGDHNVRKDVTYVISQMTTSTAEQYKDLRSDVKTLSGQVAELSRAVAARGNCCEHCPGSR